MDQTTILIFSHVLICTTRTLRDRIKRSGRQEEGRLAPPMCLSDTGSDPERELRNRPGPKLTVHLPTVPGLSNLKGDETCIERERSTVWPSC